MNILIRYINRIRSRRTLKNDESKNVVAGIVKARQLYKALAIKAHPDRNIHNKELAQDIMSRLTQNRHNYGALLEIQKEIEEKLN